MADPVAMGLGTVGQMMGAQPPSAGGIAQMIGAPPPPGGFSDGAQVVGQQPDDGMVASVAPTAQPAQQPMSYEEFVRQMMGGG